MTDLQLVPLNKLVEELQNRADDSIIILNQKQSIGNAQMIYRYKGSFLVCMGLCQSMSFSLNNDLLKDFIKTVEPE